MLRRLSKALALMLISQVWLLGVPIIGLNAVGIRASSAQNPNGSARISSSRGTLPLSAFYDTPNPLPTGKPGDLIRFAPFDDYYLSADFSAVRILYHSRSAAGDDVAVSGVVLVPDGTPPKGGWPVIAWAHAFSGASRQCAPSLMQNLYHGPFLSMYLNLGYAVVATDYAGLGTNSRNAVMDKLSNASDVLYSIAAARKALPQLGSKWIAMGPGMGGIAAIGVAEMENDIRDPDYLGSVAISGVADLQDVYRQLVKRPSGSAAVLLAYGIKTVYPQFRVEEILTDKAMPPYQQVDKTCASLGDTPGVSSHELLRQNWEENKFVKQFLDRNTLGVKPVYGPLLVVGDDADPDVPASMTARILDRMCKQGDRIQFENFSDPDPGRVIGDSVREQMNWIQARFAGRTAPSNCP